MAGEGGLNRDGQGWGTEGKKLVWSAQISAWFKKKELHVEVSTVLSSSAARGLGSDMTIVGVIPSDCPFMLQCFYPLPSCLALLWAADPLGFSFSFIFRLFIW